MTYVATVTSKGQVTIPKEIRDELGLIPSSRIIFQSQGDEILVKPITNFLDLKGSVKGSRRYSDHKADQAVLRAVKQAYEKESS